MKILMNFVSFVYVLLFIACSSSRMDVYVMESGVDSNPGTRNKPFRTIEKAKNAVREIVSSGRGKIITVWIGSGTYILNEPLVLGPGDSGPEEGYVVYRGIPGGNVEFSGGIEIKDWEKRKEGIWVAHLQKHEFGDNNFRELFIDGQRAIRARTPNKGFLRVAEVGADRRTNFRYNANDFPMPANPLDVELVLLHDWEITRINLSGIDPVKRIITAKDSIGTKGFDPLNINFNIDSWDKHPRYFLENSLAFLDADNEWYYDRNEGLLYLQLKKEESPVNKRVVIPHLTNTLLRLEGTETQKIKNVHFENITFSYCSWPLPAEGFCGIQACHFNLRGNKIWKVVPAAVEVLWSENISFENCRFTHLGGSGLMLGTGTVKCRVSGCQFDDISGNGVMIGEGNDRTVDGELWWEKVPGQVASGNIIENSSIGACGKQFFGAVGIWCGLAANTAIIGNLVFEIPYTGISVGWMWNSVPTPCMGNIVDRNHIHQVMQILSDGGGIYMLGLQPGSRITNNQINDIPLAAGSSPSNGIFLDGGTTGVEISGNLIYHIAKTPLRIPKSCINIVKNNILACSGDNPPLRYNIIPEDKNLVLEDNQVLREDHPGHMKILESAISKWELKKK